MAENPVPQVPGEPIPTNWTIMRLLKIVIQYCKGISRSVSTIIQFCQNIGNTLQAIQLTQAQQAATLVALQNQLNEVATQVEALYTLLTTPPPPPQPAGFEVAVTKNDPTND
jgi:hypothetical protein